MVPPLLGGLDDLPRVVAAHGVENVVIAFSFSKEPRLVKAIREARTDSEDHLLDNDEHLELYSKLVTTLPPELRPEFRRLTMSRTIADIIERQAAFELGRQVERQRIKR